MPKLPRNIAESQGAKLWKALGEKEFCERFSAVLGQTKERGNYKRLPAALGISPVSFYGILAGRCSYGLFLEKIAPAALERTRSEQHGRAAGPADGILSKAQWEQLNLGSFITKYAPQLVNSSQAGSPSPTPGSVAQQQAPLLNEIFDVGHDLVEDVIPYVVQICAAAHQEIPTAATKRPARSPKAAALARENEIRALQRVVDAVNFPAGVLSNSTSSTLVACNKGLAEVLRVRPSQLLGESLRHLIGCALRHIPQRMQQEFNDLLSRRMGARVSQSREKGPLCFQFYLNVDGSRTYASGCYRVTMVALGAGVFGGASQDLAVFCYHLKPAGPLAP